MPTTTAILAGRAYLARVKADMGKIPYAAMSIEQKDAAFGCTDERAATYGEAPIAMADGPMVVAPSVVTEESLESVVASLVRRYGIDAVRASVGVPTAIPATVKASAPVKRPSVKRSSPGKRPEFCRSGATCYVGPMVDALKVCLMATSKNRPLDHVLLESLPDGEGYIRLTTTDNRTGIVQVVPARYSTAVRFLVPCRQLLDSLKSSDKSAELRICPEEIPGRMDAYIGDRSASYACATDDSFPSIPAPSDILTTVRMDADPLAEVLDGMKRIHGKGQPQGYEKVLFELLDSRIRLVATDTIRLLYSRELLDTIGTQGTKVEAMIPADCCRVFARAIGDMSEVSIGFAEDMAFAELANGRIVMRLADREFPNYRKILPKDSKHTAVFDADTMRQAIKSVEHVAKDSKRKVTFAFYADRIKVSAESHEGKASAEVAASCPTITDEAVKLAFNCGFIADCLELGSASWSITSPIHPATILGVSGDTWLVMPINV